MSMMLPTRVADLPPGAPATLSERVVDRVATFLGRGQSRRSFLGRAALVGSAVVVNPFTYILTACEPDTAICGSCNDGWTAFCCTVNNGRNTCPEGSFVAGWWKADNAAYCCGAARYIIDCNATCPTRCSCRCAGNSCDNRRTCCNQFRYGQCHQEISCFGPVVCRVATCTPPWQYDPSCTTRSATDNRTVRHGSPCLSSDCNAIEAKYLERVDVLGAEVQSERGTPDNRGAYALYERGGIWWTGSTGAHAVWGPAYDHYRSLGSSSGALRFPVSDVTPTPDGRGSYVGFESGQIMSTDATGTRAVYGSHHSRWSALGKEGGPLGYPTSTTGATSDGGRFTRFEGGSVYSSRSTPGIDVQGDHDEKYRGLGGTSGVLRYPVSGTAGTPDGGLRTRFQSGIILSKPNTGVHEVHGGLYDRYASLGAEAGVLRFPTSDEEPLADPAGVTDARVNTFERGAIYFRPFIGAFEIHAALWDEYQRLGGPGGDLGLPTSDVFTAPNGERVSAFDNGELRYDPSTGGVTQG